MKEMICIVCPMGCRLTVTKSNGSYIISGNECRRGQKYALEEMIAPKRVLTSIVKLREGHSRMLPVKSSDLVPKEMIFDFLSVLKDVEVEAPIKGGQVVVQNVLNSGIDFIATKSIDKK
jgi:CxxC motif-containing protein